MATYSIEIRSSDGQTVRGSVSVYVDDETDETEPWTLERYPDGLLMDETPSRIMSMLVNELDELRIIQQAGLDAAVESSQAKKRLAGANGNRQ